MSAFFLTATARSMQEIWCGTDQSFLSFFHSSKSGIVNVYGRDVLNTNVYKPTPLKALGNLTTRVQEIKFNHDAQLMGISSNRKRDQFRLVHLPSLTVFSNWPTAATPLSYVSSFDFSPRSGYLAIGNDKGRVLLYRLNHYPSA